MLAFLGASWRSWADSGAILRPSGDHLGPFRAMLGPSWDHLGTVLGHLGPSWAILGPSWDGLGPEVWPEWLGPMCAGRLAPHFGPILGPKTGPKIGKNLFKNWLRFLIPFFGGFGALWVPLGGLPGHSEAVLDGLGPQKPLKN